MYKFPIQFHLQNTIIFCSASQKALDKRLEGTGMVPAFYFNKRPIVMVMIATFSNTIVGPYDEIMLGIYISPRKTNTVSNVIDLYRKFENRQIGGHITDIYVTLEATKNLGRTLWYYPKEILDIKTMIDDKNFSCLVKSQDHNPILNLSGNFGFRIPTPPMPEDDTTYSFKDGKTLKTRVKRVGKTKIYLGSKVNWEIQDSSHNLVKSVLDYDMIGHELLITKDSPMTFNSYEGIILDR